MKEILFRGWSDYHDDWVYGWYVDMHIISGVIESNEEYILIEYWEPIVEGSLEVYVGDRDADGSRKFETVKGVEGFESMEITGDDHGTLSR